MNQKIRGQGLNTLLNHPVAVPLPEGNRPVIAPIYHSSKFALSDDSPYWDQFVYSRISNPTVRQLEESLAKIQQRETCLTFSSGIAAITNTMLSLLEQGDHVISFYESYKPSRVFIRDFLPKFGVEHTLLHLDDLNGLESAIIPGRTKLLHFESPTNPNQTVADIEAILRVAKKHDVLVSMDGTFAGLHQHTQYPVDLMIQSLTKFANGHGDVIAGSVAGSTDLIARIKRTSILLGAALDPQAANLIQRGLKTYKLRFDQQNRSALLLANWLHSHPEVEAVYYPGLEDHPEHRLAERQMPQMGAVVSFTLKHIPAKDFAHRLKLISFTVSLGSAESLICPTLQFFGDDLDGPTRQRIGITERSLRLSVGIEDPEDLIQDLEQAFASFQ